MKWFAEACEYIAVREGMTMFLGLAILLVLLWAGGFFVMHVSSLFIHILLLLAFISIITHLFAGNKSA